MRGDYGQNQQETGTCEYLVSACMAGYPCRYDGASRPVPEIVELCQQGWAYPVCPEELGQLLTPRPAADIASDSGEQVLDGTAHVLRRTGGDVTANFIAGAQRTLEIARSIGVTKAILKSRSPSCGVGEIYRNGKLVTGNGVCAALLIREGFEVTAR